MKRYIAYLLIVSSFLAGITIPLLFSNVVKMIESLVG